MEPVNPIEIAFEEYEVLKVQIKKMEERMEELKPILLESMPPDGEQVEGQYGVFRLQAKTTWKFSPEVEDMRKELKKKEADEKARGIAAGEINEILIYTTNK